MSYEAVAERYARAIFELATEANQVKQLTDQIQKMADAYSISAPLRSVVDNPLVPEEQRDAVLEGLGARLSMSPLALNSVKLLARRRRLPALPDVARKLNHLADEKAGIVRAVVTSAGPLPEAYFSKLKTSLERGTGKKIVIERLQDPSILGGVVTRIGDNTIDGSVRGQLDELERTLVARASA